MKSRHSTDERLLALLDGELRLVEGLKLRAHLHACWECRSRLARLESAAHALADAGRQSRFLPSERVEAARRRFLEVSARKVEDSAPHSLLDAVGALDWLWRRGVVLTGAGVLGLAAALTVWNVSRPPADVKPEPRPVVVPRVVPQAEPPARQVARVWSAPKRVTIPEPVFVVPESRRDVLADEVAVWSALHEVGLCRGHGVQIGLDGDRVRLSGVIADEGQRDSLAARLEERGVEAVIDVVLADEAASDAMVLPPAESGAERVRRAKAPGEALLQEWLSHQTPGDRKSAVELANASVLTADLAWGEAWAIREVASRFAPVWGELSESSRSAVLSLLRDHSAELRTLAARQRQLIGDVLPTPDHAVTDLHAAVEQWNRAVQDLFAPTEPVTTPVDVLTGRVASALAFMEAMGGDDAALTSLIHGARPAESSAAAR